MPTRHAPIRFVPPVVSGPRAGAPPVTTGGDTARGLWRWPVPRAPAIVDLRAPPLAVWSGEVVVVAGPDLEALRGLFVEACVRGRGRLRVAEPARGYAEPLDTRRLAEWAAGGAAVLAGVHVVPQPGTRRVLAAVRAGVARRRVPCRCLWLAGGRVLPE